RKIAECRAFHEGDIICYYGQRCRFAHTRESVCEAHEKGGEEVLFFRLQAFTNTWGETEEEKDAEQFVAELLQEHGVNDIQKDSCQVEYINTLSPPRVIHPNELTRSESSDSTEKNTIYPLLTPPLLRCDQNTQLPLSPQRLLIFGDMNLSPPLKDTNKGSFESCGKLQLMNNTLNKSELAIIFLSNVES
ncbi:MAG: hypothetical protein EZS28_010055, partial [Streblomastix strix]